MNLYLLSLVLGPVRSWDYYDAQVVRAPSEAAARLLCALGDEAYKQPDVWTLPEHVSCEILAEGVAGDAEIVLASFNAG